MKQTSFTLLLLLMLGVNSYAVTDITGTYYLKNVATGKYLGAGNNWDTQASLCEHGMPMTITETTDSTYCIETKLLGWYGKAGYGYLSENGYLDSWKKDLKIEVVGNGVIAITADGENYLAGNDSNTIVEYSSNDVKDNYAQWKLVTREDLVAALGKASLTNPVDATFYIGNPAFYPNYEYDTWQNLVSTNYGAYTDKNNNVNICVTTANGISDFYQEINGLPTGIYKLCMQGYIDSVTNSSINFYANQREKLVCTAGEETTISTPTSQYEAGVAFRNGYYCNALYVKVKDSSMRIGVKSNNGNISPRGYFDNFELYYLGSKDIPECAAPIITFSDGKIEAKSSTEGSTCHISWSLSEMLGSEAENSDLNLSLVVSAYATADGFLESEMTTTTIPFSLGEIGDVNADNIVDIADVNAVLTKMFSKE